MLASTAALLEQLVTARGAAGLFLDFDGVLAPIVPRPDDAFPPAEARREIERLVSRYALVGVVSGRESADVSARVGVEGVVYVGSHGLELDPEAERWREPLAAFAAATAWPETELKGLSITFHFRNAADERAAVGALEGIAAEAENAGLVARFGRKVLEVLPPVEANKGTAIRRLLADRHLQAALVAGDDTTDLDAFAAVDGLALAVRVAVAASESPAALRESADVVVADTPEFLALLRSL